MKKTFNINELDCANCAIKIEDAIKKIDGVNSVNVSFITQKITIDTDDDNDFNEIVKKANKACKKVDRHTSIS